MVHHLNDNVIIGTVDEANEQLTIIDEQLPRIQDGEDKTKLQSRFDYLKTLFRLWEKYKSTIQDAPFIEWAYEQERFEW